jgi:hypothetical protein
VIFTSLGLLLVALGFLIGGIAKSSVALLMVSLFVTIGAGIVLVLVATAARRIVEAQGLHASPAPSTTIDLTGYAPVGNGATAPIVGYEVMTVDQVVKLIRSGALSDEQLTALQAYELGHQGRKTILDRVERVLT